MQPFTPLAAEATWTLRIAETRLDSGDPMLRHKTTRRAVYDAARAEFSRDDADEVILLNQRGEVCEGTITNIFIDIGEPVLVTPPLSSGLLPGVLRGELIATGKATEAMLTERGSASGESDFRWQFAARIDQGEAGTRLTRPPAATTLCSHEFIGKANGQQHHIFGSPVA